MLIPLAIAAMFFRTGIITSISEALENGGGAILLQVEWRVLVLMHAATKTILVG